MPESAAELTEDATTPSTDEEAAALIAGLDDFVGYITGDDDNDIVDLETLLAVGSDASDTSDADSQSETVGEESDGEEAESTDSEAADADSEVDPDAAETEDAPADEVEGEQPPETEAPKAKAVPPDSKDLRVLRDSHKFRVAVEPLIKDYTEDLPQVVGIAAAVRTGKGDDALGAISAYSESAASSIRSHVLESEAEGYVAEKLGVTPEALKAMFSEAPETPEALKAEMEYLSDEARAELETLLRKPALSAEKDKAVQAKLEAVTKDLIDERRGAVEAAIEWKFSDLIEKAKLTEKPEVISQLVLARVQAPQDGEPNKDIAGANKAIQDAFTHAAEGRKNDAARSMKAFFRGLAEIVKEMAAKQAPAKATAAADPKKVTAPKAPIVKPTATAKAKAASAATTHPVESAKGSKTYSDKDFLEFGRAEAKRLGVPWKD